MTGFKEQSMTICFLKNILVSNWCVCEKLGPLYVVVSRKSTDKVYYGFESYRRIMIVKVV